MSCPEDRVSQPSSPSSGSPPVFLVFQGAIQEILKLLFHSLILLVSLYSLPVPSTSCSLHWTLKKNQLQTCWCPDMFWKHLFAIVPTFPMKSLFQHDIRKCTENGFRDRNVKCISIWVVDIKTPLLSSTYTLFKSTSRSFSQSFPFPAFLRSF